LEEEIVMDSRIVKRKFLLSTAVLLAGVSLASAQGMREGAGAGGGMGGGGEHGISSGASGGRSSGSEMSRGAQRDEGMQSQTRGQGMREEGQGLREGGRAEGQSERQIDRDQTRRGQAQGSQKGQKDQTIGQGRDATIDQGKRDSDRARRSEGERRDTPGGAQTRQSQEMQRQDRTGDRSGTTTLGQSKTGAATQSQTGGQTGAATQQSQAGTMNQTEANRTTLSTQQQATIRQSVLSASNAPRVNVNSINFAINVGVSVPSHVNAVSVSTFPALIDVFPRYRDDSFFVVEDEIVFLDRDRRVVDVVPAGPRTRFSRSSTGGSTAAGLNLGEAEIRQVQQVLIERGLLTGEADGVLGSRTEAALVTFQRQQGIQTTGSIDTHTVDALGLSNRIGQRTGQSTTGSSQSSTVGQSQTGTQQQQPSAQQNTTTGPASGQANAPTPQNQSTTGQAGGQQQQPAQQNTQPPTQQNTTGQAAPQNQSTVGQGGNQPGASPNMPSGGQAPSTSGQGTSGQGNMPAQNPGQNPAEK
jgi:hypothetical protein